MRVFEACVYHLAMWQPEFILKHFEEGLRVIREAPAAALLLFVIGVIAGLLWRGRQVSIINERLKAKDDRLAEYKEKLSGASPDEAVKMIEALQAKVARLTPRRVPKTERPAILEVLRRPSDMKWTIDISWDAPTPDAEQLARDFKSLFDESGWDVSESREFDADIPAGITLTVMHAESDSARAVREALRRTGLPFKVVSDTSNRLPHIQIGHPAEDQ